MAEEFQPADDDQPNRAENFVHPRVLLWHCWLLCLLGVVVYLPAYPGQLQRMELLYVAVRSNPRQLIGWSPWESRVWPVAGGSLLLNFWISAGSRWSYILTNVLLHIGAGLLIYYLAVRVGMASRPLSLSRALNCAVITAALWLVSPLNVREVALLPGRQLVLVTFFGFATLAALVQACTFRGWGWCLLALFGVMGAFYSHPLDLRPLFLMGLALLLIGLVQVADGGLQRLAAQQDWDDRLRDRVGILLVTLLILGLGTWTFFRSDELRLLTFMQAAPRPVEP